MGVAVDEAAGRESRTELRVRYPEADRMGVAYHAHYLVWFELGRTELMRELGCSYDGLEQEQGIFFPVVEASARYRSPARYDDRLAVFTTVGAVGGATVRFDYRIRRIDDGKLLATGSTTHAAVGHDGKPMKLPAGLIVKLQAYAGAR